MRQNVNRKGVKYLERKQVKEILSKQLQLLAEVSKKSQPEHLPELTLAMCQVVNCLKNEREPYVTVSLVGCPARRG